jgi:hypothetical protein
LGFLIVFTLFCGAAFADDSLEVPRITLHVKQAPFLVVLRAICDKAHVSYRFEPDAAAFVLNSSEGGTQKVSLDVKDMPLDHVISYLLRQADLILDLTFRRENDAHGGWQPLTFSIGNGLLDRDVTVKFENVALVDALTAVCDQIGAKYALDLGRYERQAVTISLGVMPMRQCITAILEAAHAIPGLTFSSIRGILRVGYDRKEGRFEPVRNPLKVLIHLRFMHENAYYAAVAVTDSAHGNFVLDNDLKDRDVSLPRGGIPLDLALQLIGRSSGIPLSS